MQMHNQSTVIATHEINYTLKKGGSELWIIDVKLYNSLKLRFREHSLNIQDRSLS